MSQRARLEKDTHELIYQTLMNLYSFYQNKLSADEAKNKILEFISEEAKEFSTPITNIPVLDFLKDYKKELEFDLSQATDYDLQLHISEKIDAFDTVILALEEGSPNA